MSQKSALPFSISYKNLVRSYDGTGITSFILSLTGWAWHNSDSKVAVRLHNKYKVNQAISFEELIASPPHKHAEVYGRWSWQWKAITSLTDAIPPCCVQFLCATVTLFSSIFCLSEKLPSLFLRSFRITTWRKNTSGEKKNHRFSTTVIHLSFPRNVHTKKYFRNTCILPHCWSFS